MNDFTALRCPRRSIALRNHFARRQTGAKLRPGGRHFDLNASVFVQETSRHKLTSARHRRRNPHFKNRRRSQRNARRLNFFSVWQSSKNRTINLLNISQENVCLPFLHQPRLLPNHHIAFAAVAGISRYEIQHDFIRRRRIRQL